MQNTKLSGAVLVIGSLLWDQSEDRKEWRKCLELDSKIPVKVPIRYGRISSTRGDTYTLVFSTGQNILGTGYLVPFRAKTCTFNEIHLQAISLSWAEGISIEKYPDRLAAKWGVVGVKFRSSGRVPKAIVDAWSNQFENNSDFNPINFRMKDEVPAISEQGILNFEFEIPEDIDYVLATPTAPRRFDGGVGYPSPQEIVSAIESSDPPHEEYIRENIRAGIEVDSHSELIKLRPTLAPSRPKQSEDMTRK